LSVVSNLRFSKVCNWTSAAFFKFMNTANEVTYNNKFTRCFSATEYNYSCLNKMCRGICLALIHTEYLLLGYYSKVWLGMKLRVKKKTGIQFKLKNFHKSSRKTKKNTGG
jgi:hypothetical protein